MRRKYLDLNRNIRNITNQNEFQNSINITQRNANEEESYDIKKFDEDQQEKLESITIRALCRNMTQNQLASKYPQNIDALYSKKIILFFRKIH